MKPILFSTPMVQAILKSRKTQTRRIIKGVPAGANFLDISENMSITCVDRNGNEYPKDVDGLYATFEHNGWSEFPVFKALYQPGDILWVRETWAHIPETTPGNIHYKASATNADLDWFKENGWKWRPSIHMPREAARIFLRVTGVRVERVTQITYGDCCAEGVFDAKELKSCFDGSVATDRYRKLWNTLNAKRGYSWESNCWVFVYEFEMTNSD